MEASLPERDVMQAPMAHCCCCPAEKMKMVTSPSFYYSPNFIALRFNCGYDRRGDVCCATVVVDVAT